MKRDMDLVRLILLAVESGPALADGTPAVAGYDAETIAYHLLIMDEAGLVLAPSVKNSLQVRVLRLTWAGHEFLESVRDDSRWRTVKTQTETAGGLVFEVIKAVASAAMLRQLNL